MCCFDRGRCGLAVKRLDIRRNRDRFNAFEVLIPGTFTPSQELLDRPVISGPVVRVTDWNRKEFKEFLSGFRPGRVMRVGAGKD